MDTIPATHFADIMGVSKATLDRWERSGTFVPHTNATGQKFFYVNELLDVPAVKQMVSTDWDEELHIIPKQRYTSVELFAGAGGLALGLSMAGFHHVLLNEINADACATLHQNRPQWTIAQGDVRDMSFTYYAGHVDLLSGGFPCQAFSYAGKQGGFDDTRGTLFFELARAAQEIQPKVLLCENVKGLMAHDQGRTLNTIKNTIRELGYTLVEPRVMKAILYKVPQKRERLILIAIRQDLADRATFTWPDPYHRIMTLRDAFFKGELYDCDVPPSPGQTYPKRKAEIMQMVPMGGYWRDLPVEVQKEYMKGSYGLSGGKTGMARRLSLDEPSLTLTCSPAMTQTERCHPTETRPLTIREYARIQTFPDAWQFEGTISSQYRQIGNAVPVNLAYAIGRALVRLLNDLT